MSETATPHCTACGAGMEQVTILANGAAGSAFGVVAIFGALLLLMAWLTSPAAWVAAAVLFATGLLVGSRRRHIWRCVSCQATIERG